MTEFNSMFRDNRVLRSIQFNVVLMLPNSSPQLPLSLSNVKGIAIIATYFINYVVSKGCKVYVLVYFYEPT